MRVASELRTRIDAKIGVPDQGEYNLLLWSDGAAMSGVNTIGRVTVCLSDWLRASLFVGMIPLLISFALRVYRLGWREIGGDEAFSFEYALFSFAEIISATQTFLEPHPVGSYFLLKAMIPFWGKSEFALRFLSVLFGTLATALVYRLVLSLRVVQPRALILAAVFAALFFALTPHVLRHTREVRMYGHVLALCGGAMWLAWRYWQRPRAVTLVGYVIVAWLAMHMHYVAIATVAALNVFWLLDQIVSRSQRWQHWVIAQVVLAALYAPWLPILLSTLEGYAGNASSFSLETVVLRTLGGLIEDDQPLRHGLLYPLVGALVLGLGGWQVARHSRRAGLMLGLCLVLPVGVVVMSSLSRSTFRERYFITALLPFAIFAGAWMAHLTTHRQRWLRIVGIALSGWLMSVPALGMGDYFDHWTASQPDWQNLVRLIQRFSDVPPDRLRIALNYPDPAFRYYYSGAASFFVLPYRPNNLSAAEEQVEEMIAQGVQRVIFQHVPHSSWDNGSGERVLRQHFSQVEEAYSGRWVVKIFGRYAEQDLALVSGRFADEVVLKRAFVRPDLTGGFVEVALQWQGMSPRRELKSFVHITPLGEPFRAILQKDEVLDASALSGQIRLFGLRFPPDLPSGTYEVRVGVYDPSLSGLDARLKLPDGSDARVIAQFTTP